MIVITESNVQPDEKATIEREAGTTTLSEFFRNQEGGWLRKKCVDAMTEYLADKGYVGQIFVIQTGGYPSVNSVIVDVTVKLQIPGKTTNNDPHSEMTFRFGCYDGANGLEDPKLRFIIPVQVGSEETTFFRPPDAEKDTDKFDKFWESHAEWMDLMAKKQAMLLRVIKELDNIGCSHMSFHDTEYPILSETADSKIVFGNDEYSFSFHFGKNKVAFANADSGRFDEDDYDEIDTVLNRIIAKTKSLTETNARGDERLS